MIYVFRNVFLNTEYYYHLVKFILFLRLLRQDYVSKLDIGNAKILINSFIKDLLRLYGTKNLSLNFHTCLHFPDQVEKHGTSHKCNCYPGESCFKECHANIYGTNNIAFQLAKKIVVTEEIRKELSNDIINTLENKELKEFYLKLKNSNYRNHKYANQNEPISIKAKRTTL